MGAFGSGARRDPLRAKRRSEDCVISLCAYELTRAGVFRNPGMGELRIGEHGIAYSVEHLPHPVMRIAFTLLRDGEARRVSQAIPLTTMPRYLGGQQWWLSCPICGRRSGKLFLPPDEDAFACRICHHLINTSAQVHDNRVYQLRKDTTRVQGILTGKIAASETEFSLALKAACSFLG